MLNKLLPLFFLYLPFQLALSPMEGIDLASARVIIPTLFLLWILAGLKNKKIFIPFSWPTLLVISFLSLSVFSIFFSQNAGWGLRKLLFLLSIFPLYFIAAGTALRVTSYELQAMRFMIYGSAMAAAVGIFQFFLQFFIGVDKLIILWSKIITPFLGESFAQAVLENPSWLVNIGGETIFRATAFFPDPHMFSFYLGLTAPLALGIYFYFKSAYPSAYSKNKEYSLRGKLQTWKQILLVPSLANKANIYLILFFVILLADLLTFSRGGYLGLLAGAIFGGGLFWNKLEVKHKKGLAVGLIFIALVFLIPNPIGSRLISSFDLNEGSNMGRIETWKHSLEIIKKNPFQGVGLGNYALEIKPSADWREPIYSHNLYLDAVAETGILNGLVLVGLLVIAAYSLLKKSALKSELKYIYLGAATGLVIFATHSFFETALFSARVLPLVVFLLALSNFSEKK